MMSEKIRVKDIGKNPDRNLTTIRPEELIPLPPPYDDFEEQPDWKELSKGARENLVCNLDGFVAVSLPKPQNAEEEKKYVDQFVDGMKKLLSRENNWTFLQPLMLSLEYCIGCQTCSDSCHVFEGSGDNEIYRPTYRSEVFRRLVNKYAKPGGKFTAALNGADVDLNWTTITRLAELAYRCNLCRRCAQVCPIGVDNGLITHEIRKVFSQELGWAPKDLHEKGTVLQLEVGSSTGMNSLVAKDNVEFIDEDMTDITGIEVETCWDKGRHRLDPLFGAGGLRRCQLRPLLR